METLSKHAGGFTQALNRSILWPAVELFGGTTLVGMCTFGGLVRYLPQPFRSFSRAFLMEISNAMNHRIILDPFASVAEVFAIAFVSGKDRQEGEDLEVFFRLGLKDFPQNHCGFGNADDPQNCFFPQALEAGPRDHSPPMTSQINLDIAKTCCFLSLLSYRPDREIRDCMTRPTETRMIPNTSFFAVHTDREGDLGVWVDHNQKWAVFCFRGTEFETGRDWFTSALLNPAVAFQSGSDDGTGHMRQAKVRDRYFTQMEYAVGRQFSLDKVVTDPAHEVFKDDASVSALGLALYLHNKEDFKIYCTGHSLGGGLATLFGAYLVSFGVYPAAVISFGSPPVGDESFCEWFQQEVPVSWRFVNEDEFAPMAPPIPFTEGRPTAEQELRHVNGLIRCEALGQHDPAAPTPEVMKARIFELCRQGHSSKLALDHNLAVTLRRLINFRAHHNGP